MICNILSVDAWHGDHGWEWNAWYATGKQYDLQDDYSNRSIIKKFRDLGLLSEHSKGKIAIEDDGYNILIVARGTQEPLYAIEYGSQA